MDEAEHARREAARKPARHRSRWLSVVVDDDGTYVVKGLLTPEAGAALQRALEAAEDVLYRRERSEEPGSAEPGVSGEPPSHRQALRAAGHWREDALGLVAARFLAAGLRDRPEGRRRFG